MKCQTKKAAEIIMKFLPLRHSEFQFYSGFLARNDHNDSMSWSEQPTFTAAHILSYCFTTQIFC